MLRVEALEAGYGEAQVLYGIDLSVDAGDRSHGRACTSKATAQTHGFTAQLSGPLIASQRQ